MNISMGNWLRVCRGLVVRLCEGNIKEFTRPCTWEWDGNKRPIENESVLGLATMGSFGSESIEPNVTPSAWPLLSTDSQPLLLEFSGGALRIGRLTVLAVSMLRWAKFFSLPLLSLQKTFSFFHFNRQTGVRSNATLQADLYQHDLLHAWLAVIVAAVAFKFNARPYKFILLH